MPLNRPIILLIEPEDKSLIEPLYDSLHEDVPIGVSIHVLQNLRRSVGSDNSIIGIAVEISVDIATGLVSAWLYDKLKKSRAQKITIDRTKVDLSKDDVVSIIKEKIQIENR